ncbi:MAG: DNA-3-methyladenine glycosylase I [Desulfuromonadaceae bacterium]
MDQTLCRCAWVGDKPIYREYHDREWGTPVHDDRLLFEFITLEGAQAGLSWLTILKKRAGYRAAFANFDPETVARFDRNRVEQLLANPAIVRNRLKIESTLSTARAFLRIQEEFGSFTAYQWRFVDGRPCRTPGAALRRYRPAATSPMP